MAYSDLIFKRFPGAKQINLAAAWLERSEETGEVTTHFRLSVDDGPFRDYDEPGIAGFWTGLKEASDAAIERLPQDLTEGRGCGHER